MADLKSQIHSLKVKTTQLERSLQIDNNEISSLQRQLDAKSVALEEAITELESKWRERSNEEAEGGRKQKKIEELNIEVYYHAIIPILL